MSVTASGQVAKPLYKLAELVASSATFRTEVGAASAAAALAYIFYPEADDTSDSTEIRPRCIIGPGQSRSASKTGTGLWEKAGELWLCFEFLVTSGATGKAEELLQFANKTGAIMAEMEANAGNFPDASAESYLDMIGWEEAEGPGRCDPRENNDVLFYAHGFSVKYRA